MRKRRFVLDGVLVEEVPCDQLPFTNMCNYCILKGTACYSRKDVTCHADSRPDGVDIVFRRVMEPPKIAVSGQRTV
jgi:hypothetical protein